MLIKSALAEKRSKRLSAASKTTTDLSGLSDALIVVEAVTEDTAVKTEVFRGARSNHHGQRNSCVEHFFDFHYETRCSNQETGQSDRHAFHESGARHEAGRSYSRRGDVGHNL
jgi:hypothetical protein